MDVRMPLTTLGITADLKEPYTACAMLLEVFIFSEFLKRFVDMIDLVGQILLRMFDRHGQKLRRFCG